MKSLYHPDVQGAVKITEREREDGTKETKVEIKPSKTGAAAGATAGAAAGAAVAGPVGAVIGGAIGYIFGPDD